MKTKKPFRKLTLTKQTITNLEDRQQDTIRGGDMVTGAGASYCEKCPITYRTVCTCNSCDHSCLIC